MALGIHQKLQSAATTGNGTAVQLNGDSSELTFYIYGTGTVSTGVITLEEAQASDYSGTWAALGSPITIVSGQTIAVHLTGCYGAVRARISTNVTGSGGSVTVDLFGSVAE